jgi:HPt (histidine-containing phosphotransfer) domain-containing protein
MIQKNTTIKLGKIRAHFLNELEKQYLEVEMLRDKLDQVADHSETCYAIGRICHKIAGTAATLGFPDLGDIAAQIDDFVASSWLTHPEAESEMRNHADHLLVLISLTFEDESVLA